MIANLLVSGTRASESRGNILAIPPDCYGIRVVLFHQHQVMILVWRKCFFGELGISLLLQWYGETFM